MMKERMKNSFSKITQRKFETDNWVFFLHSCCYFKEKKTVLIHYNYNSHLVNLRVMASQDYRAYNKMIFSFNSSRIWNEKKAIFKRKTAL